MSGGAGCLGELKGFLPGICPHDSHLRNLIRSLPPGEVRVVGLLEINLGDDYRTDCQSERQAQYLHEVVLSPAGEILECVDNTHILMYNLQCIIIIATRAYASLLIINY